MSQLSCVPCHIWSSIGATLPWTPKAHRTFKSQHHPSNDDHDDKYDDYDGNTPMTRATLALMTMTKMMTTMMTKMMTIMMTIMMTKKMTTHHRSGQLNTVLFPHLESLAKVDYLDVIFLLQKIFFKTIPFMSSTEEGRIMQCWTNTKGIVTKISSHLVAE